jgi:hypothetical protein
VIRPPRIAFVEADAAKAIGRTSAFLGNRIGTLAEEEDAVAAPSLRDERLSEATCQSGVTNVSMKVNDGTLMFVLLYGR